MKPPKRCSILLLLFAILQPPTNVFGFKIGTHVWISQQVLNDVLPDGKVTIGRREYRVDEDILAALRKYQNQYRMGLIGPDGFPDLVVPSVTAHPGVSGAWQTDDWLRWILTNARREEEKAFVFGYFGHVASDMFAHTYVNTLTGDVFLLTDGEFDNEYRHFALETYIDKHTPPLTDNSGSPIANRADRVSWPARFLADTLILNETVASQYLRPPLKGASHMLSMLGVRSTLDRAIKLTEVGQLDPTGVTISPLRQRLVAWRDDVDKGVVAYIEASGNTLREFLKPRGDPLGPILRWNECWAPVFAAVPKQIPQSVCGRSVNAASGLAGVDAEIEKLRSGLGPLSLVVDPFGDIKNFVDGELRVALTDASAAIASNVGGKDVRTLIRLMNDEVTAAELNRVFSQDRFGKGLPVYTDLASRVESEMRLTPQNHFDASAFQPVHDAIVLCKLTLLRAPELNKLARDAGVTGPTVYGAELYNETQRPFNILLDVVRSADGNHQWQGLAPPFKRQPGFKDTEWPNSRRYGYEFRDDTRGFRLWWDPQAREKVFSKIFMVPAVN